MGQPIPGRLKMEMSKKPNALECQMSIPLSSLVLQGMTQEQRAEVIDHLARLLLEAMDGKEDQDDQT